MTGQWRINVREVARWLSNVDGEGCDDIQFAETLFLMYKMCITENPDVLLTKQDFNKSTLEDIMESIHNSLDEIVFSDEVMQSAWWKR